MTTLQRSKSLRWIVLALASLVMMMGYVVAKQMSPLQHFLELPVGEGGMAWSGTEYGIFAGARGFLNVFLLLLFVSGYILDRWGTHIAGTLSCIFMLMGATVIWMALSYISPAKYITATTLPLVNTSGIKIQVLVAALGFAIFGVGYELCGIVVSKILVKWFSGKEIAFAMGAQVALARFGTALTIGLSPYLAHHYNLLVPIASGVVLVTAALILFLIYCKIDKQEVLHTGSNEPEFSIASVKQVLRNRGFWLITLLCMLYYSALYPFLDFATDIMIAKYNFEPKLAGLIPAILPFTSIVLTPLFGSIYDHWGRGATLMVGGTVLLTVVLVIFALPYQGQSLAITSMIILGVGFSLLPAVLWPAVPKIVPQALLGSAYSIIYYIQNIGLMIVPILIGATISKNTTGDSDYTTPMLIFTALGIFSIIVAVCLFRADTRNNYGLEKANLQA